MLDSPKPSTSLAQSIELARAEKVGPHGVAAKDFDAALKRTEEALDWLRAGYANGSLPHLKIPEERGDLATIEGAAKRLRDGASDVVFLGTGGSSLGGQTLLQLAGHNVPGIGTLRDKPRLHFLDNLDPQTFGEMLGKLPLATTKFVAISKSGGTGETLMQTMAVLDALKRAGLEAKIPELLLGLSEPAKAGGKNGLRTMLEHFKVPMLDHHTGIGGRFSVLTNVGLLPAAVAGLDIAAIRAGAAKAVAPVLAKKAAADVPSGRRRCAVDRAGRHGQDHHRADALCRPAGVAREMVRAALGRKPRQGRQGHDAARSAGPGRPAQPVAAVHRRSARQAVHDHHRRREGQGAAHAGGPRKALRRGRRSAARPSAIWWRRRAAPPPRRWRRTAARCAPSTSRPSTRRRWANC